MGDEKEQRKAEAKKTYEDCEDPELEDLLQSTLTDFAAKPVLGATGGGKTEEGREGGDDPAGWDEEKFIAEATTHFEQSMRAMMSATGGAVGDPGAVESELSKVFEQIFQGAPLSGPSASGDPMEDMMKMMSSMGLHAGPTPRSDSAEIPSPLGADPAEGPAALLPIMSGLLKQVLSKDVLYPSLSGILDRFPKYMEENEEKLDDEDVQRYKEQQRLMKLVCEEFDKEDDANFDQIFNLMQEMQSHGHPPKEVIDGADSPTDLSAFGLDPGALAGGQSDCCIM